MDLESFREYCLRKPNATEEMPFGPDVLVFKVGGKMFALAALDEVPATANLKCDPDLALELRDRYEQETLEHGRDRRRNSRCRIGRNDRPLLWACGQQSAESEACGAVVVEAAVSAARPLAPRASLPPRRSPRRAPLHLGRVQHFA